MPYNVTEQDVKNIMETELTAGELTPFLETAVVWAGTRFGVPDTDTQGLHDKLVLYYAAHAATTKDPEIIEEAAKGQTRGKYAFKVGEGLKRSSYGQMILELLDAAGLEIPVRRGVAFYGFGATNNHYA